MYSLLFQFENAKCAFAEIKYLHNGKSSLCSAFETDENASVRILFPRKLGTVSASLILLSEDLKREEGVFDFSWVGIKGRCDVYEAALDTKKIGVGLYFFYLRLDTAFGILYAGKQDEKAVITKEKPSRFLQLSVSEFPYHRTERKYGGIIYHIFVDRFRRGGKVPVKDGALLVEDWRGGVPEYPEYPGAPLKNNTFYGGTLYGIIEKLDYIASLGVNTLYLSPIFDAASNHKYDTADYMTVDAMFGGEVALKKLIKEAKKRNIGIILDGVFNHTGSDSIYFNKKGTYNSVGAYQSKSSPYYSWYEFQEYPDKYTAWWGIEILPRIHPSRRECGEYFTGKGGVIEKYAKLGIDGFRLDVADELSDEFISSIKEKLSESNKSSVLYGEVWEDASNKIAYDTRKKYYLGKELDGVMNYPLREGIIKYIKCKDTGTLFYALTDIINNAPKRIADLQMNLLGTHDTERILTVLGGEDGAGRSNAYLSGKRMSDLERGLAKRRLKMAYIILSTLPGIPAIFYGDEAGLEGYHDPFNRLPYPWDKEDNALIGFYRNIGKIRREHSVYETGEFRLLCLDRDLLVFSRYNETGAYITVANNSKSGIEITFKKEAKIINADSEKTSSDFQLSAFEAAVFVTDLDNDIYIN